MTAVLPQPVLAVMAVPGERGGTHLLAGGPQGLAISLDGGASWTLGWGGGLVAALGRCRTGAGEIVLLAGVNGGIIRSDAGGREWTSHPFPLPAPIVVSICTVQGEDGGDVVLAGTHQDGVFRSDDGGQTWRSANIGLYLYQITALSSVDGKRAVAATEHLSFETSNAGLSWNEIPGFDPNTRVTAIGGDGQRLVFGTDGGELLVYQRDHQESQTRVLLDPADEVVGLQLWGASLHRELIAVTSNSLHRVRVTGMAGRVEVGGLSSRPIPASASCAVFVDLGDGIRAIIGGHDGSVVVEAVGLD